MDILADQPISGSALHADGEQSLGTGLAQLVDELAHGVIVTALDGKLLHANQAARHELARKRVLATQHSVLHALSSENTKVLQEALSKIAAGKRSLIQLKAPQGPTLTLAALPLKTHEGRPPRAAFLFARVAVCDSLMLGFFARSHGLTATEEHVLGILSEGFSAPEIAAQMGVAVSTARSHIRSLCAKTRSSGVRELVTRIAVLPPVAPPFWHEPMH